MTENHGGSSKRSAPKTRGNNKIIKATCGAVLLLVVFAAGIGVGNGRITVPGGHSAVNSQLPATLDYSSVNKVYQSLKANYDGKLTESQLLDGLKHGLAESTNDPYTTYFTSAEAQSFKDGLNNTFSGIGAELGQDDHKNIQVISPISGMPAEKAGIKAGDLIATINGKATTGMTVDDAVNLIRGKAGTQVKLQIVRDNNEQDITITRQDIQLPSVKHKVLDNNIGYIQISTFADDTPTLITQAANDLKKANVKGIVLDLRDNPGGEVTSAVAVSSEWLPGGSTIMEEKQGNTVLQTYQSTGVATLHDIPTVVLVNGGSASASEITAAALHDNKQATVMGEKSYGKGVVQQLIDFNDGSQLKVTVASWYRPNGKNINHLGITPDTTVKISDDDAKAGNDTQLKAAEDYLNK